MNIIDIQDQLKNFSENQLIQEMQMPSGNAPQFLVLSEIQRRKRVRDNFAQQQAANEPTVAEEAVAAAGVPMQGIAGMSEAMAPQSAASGGIGTIMPESMRQAAPAPDMNPEEMAMAMRSGGLLSYGEELSSRMSQDKIDPFLDEVEQMADSRFGLSSNVDTTKGFGQLPGPRIPDRMPFLGRPVAEPAYPINNMPFPVKGGAMGEIMPAVMQSSQFRGGPLSRYAEGGPLGLRQFNPGNIRPGAGFLGETGVGGGYAQFESPEYGLRALSRLLGTYGQKRGVNTLRGLVSRYAPKSDNPESFENYIKYMSDKLGVDPDEEIDLAGRRAELIPAIVGFEQGQQPFSEDQISRAITASQTDDPDEVSSILNAPLNEVLADRGVNASDLFQQDVDPGLMSAMADTSALVRPVGPKILGETPFTGGPNNTIGDSTDGTIQIPDVVPPALMDKDTGEPLTKGEAGIVPKDHPDANKPAITTPDPSTGAPVFIGDPGVENVKPEDVAERIENFKEETGQTDPDDDGKSGTSTQSALGSTNITLNNKSDTYAATDLVEEIKALQAKMEKNRESDKWLALAQAGMALMSSKEPTLLGAAGEAGIAGLTAMREANERYEEGVVDLINARAKITGKDKMGLTGSNVVSRINQLTESIAGGMLTAEEKAAAENEIISLKRLVGIPLFAA